MRGRGYAVSKGDRGIQLAGEMFLKAVELDPGFIRAWISLAEACATHAVFFGNKAHWREVAKKAGEKLMELAPHRAESVLAYAYALTANGEFEEAESVFKKAIELDSTLGTAYQFLARAQQHQGKIREAADNFAVASKCDSEDYESAMLGATLYEGIGDTTNARKLAIIGVERAEKNLEDFPDNQRAYYLGAGSHLFLGQTDRAHEWIERALALNPEDIATRYNSACFYARVGEIEKALDCLENSLSSRTWIENDPDLNSLRDHPRYREILDALPR